MPEPLRMPRRFDDAVRWCACATARAPSRDRDRRARYAPRVRCSSRSSRSRSAGRSLLAPLGEPRRAQRTDRLSRRRRRERRVARRGRPSARRTRKSASRRASVELIGRLDDLVTNSGFLVAPFVGVIHERIDYVLQESEVDGSLRGADRAHCSTSAIPRCAT